MKVRIKYRIAIIVIAWILALIVGLLFKFDTGDILGLLFGVLLVNLPWDNLFPQKAKGLTKKIKAVHVLHALAILFIVRWAQESLCGHEWTITFPQLETPIAFILLLGALLIVWVNGRKLRKKQ